MSYLPRTSRRRPVARAKWVVVFVLATAALLAFCGHPGRHTAQRRDLTRCRASQISVTESQLGAAVSGGWLIRYRNVGSSACTLAGYPTVVALVSPTGPLRVAAHVSLGYLGGWESLKPLPAAVLAARSGVASSVVEYVSDGTAQDLLLGQGPSALVAFSLVGPARWHATNCAGCFRAVLLWLHSDPVRSGHNWVRATVASGPLVGRPSPSLA